MARQFKNPAYKDDPLFKRASESAATSSSWSERKKCYESAVEVFKKLEPFSAQWSKFVHVIEAVADERNVSAQEKGLEAVFSYVSNCAKMDDQAVATVINGILKRFIADSKLRNQELVGAISLALIEKNKTEDVMDLLLTGLEAKNVKHVFVCMRILTEALVKFGPDVVNTHSLTPKIVSLCVDKTMFQEDAKNLLKELYKWEGSAIREKLLALDMTQLRALEIEFAKVGQSRNDYRTTNGQKRYLRTTSAKTQDQKGNIQTAQRRPMSSACSRKIDSRPLNPRQTSLPAQRMNTSACEKVTPKPKGKDKSGACGDRFNGKKKSRNTNNCPTPMDFSEIFGLIESKQWGERKDALDGLMQVIDSPKEIPFLNYDRTIKVLRNVILTDTNVVLVSKAVQCVTALAKRKDKAFRQHAPLLMTLLLEKFKEKKSIVVEAIRHATDSVYLNYGFGCIARYVTISLENQNPSIKSETELFLCRCFSRPTPTLLQPVNWQPLVNGLIKNLTFQDQSVRENAMRALGIMSKAVGYETLYPFLDKIQKHQLAMTNRFREEATVIFEETTSEVTDSADQMVLFEDKSNDERIGKSSKPINYKLMNHFMPNKKCATEFSSTSYTTEETLIVCSSEEYISCCNVRNSSACDDEKNSMKDVKYGRGLKSLNANAVEIQNLANFGKKKAHETDKPLNSQQEKIPISLVNLSPNLPLAFHSKEPSIENRRKKCLSPAAQDKLATLRSTLEHLRSMWSEIQKPASPSMVNGKKRNVEEEIAQKLESLETNIDECFKEIQALSPMLYEELNGPNSSTKGDVPILRQFNNKLSRMELLLKLMVFDESNEHGAGTGWKKSSR